MILENLGESWRILENLGESWRILADPERLAENLDHGKESSGIDDRVVILRF